MDSLSDNFLFRRLQSPFSCLIINLAIGDLGTSCLHIMVVVSSFKGKWAFGSTGCVFYAFGVGFFGMMSIFTLAAISVERYLVITSRPLSSWKLTRRGARKICFFSWIYCTSLVTPPLFGWSRYTLEGLLTSCSWDYTTKTVSNTVYYLYLLGFGFIVPVAVITYCYTSIVSAVFAHGREMAGVDMTSGRSGNSGVGKSTSLNNAHSTSLKTAEIIFILIAFFFLSWTPYAVITFIGHFGPEGILNPWITAMPAYFAKMSVIYNPIVYGLSHPHFQSSVKQYLSTWMASSSNNSKDNEEPTTGRNAAVALNPIKHDQHFR
ncbi:rhodopsin, GQ-coupled-like [Cimex lectularius]|uniref:G-protein coupled receptors family 1 profile domain-containing protein n=1 Tax=Cimex lectularius TaxID=79782 RepID=A0A8I6SNI0_CIMLE|nr:rhodopsin, GQ-coupled-like [Cimex lectularius]